jgi:hypothetical protein
MEHARVGSFPLSDIRVDQSRVRFSAAPDGETLAFDLVRTDIGYRGRVSTRAGRYAASFAIRPGSPPPAVLAGYEGTYRLGPDRLLTLSRNNASAGFWYVELRTNSVPRSVPSVFQSSVPVSSVVAQKNVVFPTVARPNGFDPTENGCVLMSLSSCT